jgi:hypothetical protein
MHESLLRAVLATVARQVFPPDKVLEILAARNSGKKQIAAYNLCDGATPQAEIGKRAGLDKGSLSRSIARWTDAGIVVRIGPNDLPLHVYPLSFSTNSKSK